jgi:hypothetical protein
VLIHRRVLLDVHVKQTRRSGIINNWVTQALQTEPKWRSSTCPWSSK